ncbi:alpha/beta hydrolase [Devosia chinhatensis]|nr:alpha/beta hydrolase [Devosia chinhatensis]
MHIDPLDIFNLLIPKDRGSSRIAKDLAYGPHERHRLDIYAPRRANAQSLPVIVFFYGGSWESGRRQAYAFVGHALASLGYVVVVPDYRLLPEVEYPLFLDDCAAALRWVRSHSASYGGDSGRIALAGHSAGAYNAMMVALDPGLRTKAGVGPFLKGVAGLSGPYDFFPFDGEVSRRVFGAVPDGLATQPISHVTKQAPPLWLGTGDADRMVLPRNSDSLKRLLRAAGGQAEVHHYAGIDHAGALLALSQPLRFRAPILRDMGVFFERVLTPSPALADDGALQ